MKKEEITKFVKENKRDFARGAAIGVAIGAFISLAIRNRELNEYAKGMKVKEAWAITFDDGTEAVELLRHNGSIQLMKKVDEPVQELAS